MSNPNYRRWRRIVVWSVLTASGIFLLDFFYTANMVAI